MITPTLTPTEARLVKRIADRAYLRIQQLSCPLYKRATCASDVSQVHAGSCPLDLQRLLKASDFDFLHDIFGIKKHLDRRIGRLRNNFRPRTAKR